MRTALVDIASESPLPQPASALPFFPSPALLRYGRAAVRAGEEVSYHRINAASLSRASVKAPGLPTELAPELSAALAAAERVLVAASGPSRVAFEQLDGALRGATLIDPATAVDAEPDYALARGHTSCQAEVDAAPWWAPVHPWAFGHVPSSLAAEQRPSAERAAERFAAAAASLSGVSSASLYCNDPQQPLDMERLRQLARGVHGALDAHNTLVGLHLRLWPQELLREERLADHLTLLPIESLEVLCGSFHPPTAAHDPRVGGIAAVHETLQRLSKSGLSRLCTVSLSIGLPGEYAEDCVNALNAAVGACTSARIRRLRVAVYLGGGSAPASAAEQHARFAKSHADWHPMEYRALFDMAVLLQSAVPELTLIGPGWHPGWEPPAEA